MRNHLRRVLGLLAVTAFPVVATSTSFTPLGDLSGGTFFSYASDVSAEIAQRLAPHR